MDREECNRMYDRPEEDEPPTGPFGRIVPADEKISVSAIHHRLGYRMVLACRFALGDRVRVIRSQNFTAGMVVTRVCFTGWERPLPSVLYGCDGEEPMWEEDELALAGDGT